MKWGETQNLLSVIIGLNVAYYAFKEMRAPHLATLKRNVDELSDNYSGRIDDLLAVITKIPKGGELFSAVMKVWMEVMELRSGVSVLVVGTSARRFENLIGLPAMFVAMATTILLVVSTVKYEELISPWLFYPITVVGFLPVVTAVLINYAILWFAAAEYEKKYHQYWRFLHIDLDGHLEPHRRTIAEAKAARSRSKENAMGASEDPEAG